MNCAVVYFSRSGNTKKLADGVAEVLGVTASDITTSLTEKTDLVFLGSSLYAGGFDPAVGEFIRKNADKIGKLVCFGSSASGTSTAKKGKSTCFGAWHRSLRRYLQLPRSFPFHAQGSS